MSEKKDPEFVTMKMYHADRVKLEHRLTRVEVIAGIVSPVVTGFILFALLKIFGLR